MYPCKGCGVPLTWRTVDDRTKPFTQDGLIHDCPQFRAKKTPSSTLLDTEAMEARVRALITEAVNKEILLLRIRNAEIIGAGISEYKDTVDKQLEGLVNAINAAMPKMVDESVRKLVPQEHFIRVETPDTTRILDGIRPHKTLPKLIALTNLRQHAYLVGPAGGGKTTAAEQAAAVLGLPFYARSMGPATTEWDLMGFRSPSGAYVPGIMREPYEKGGLLCLDELDNSNPSVLTSLNAALDGQWASFPDKMVKRHSDFVVVGGANTFGRGADRIYVGRMQLDGATLNRFGFVEWDYDEEAEFDWAGRDQSNWVEWVQGVRHKLADLHIRHVVGPRNSIK